MVQDLPIRLSRSVWGRGLLVLALLLFFGRLSFDLVSPSFPAKWKRKFPWGMFSSYSNWRRVVVIEGRRGESWEKIDLKRWYRYARGSSDIRLYDDHPAFRKPTANYYPELDDLLAWIALQTRDEGYQELRASLRLLRFESDERRVVELRRCEVNAETLARAAALEAR